MRGADAEELRDPGPAGIGGYVLGVFPYLPPSSLDRRFAPIVEALRQRIGQPVHLRTKSDLEAFAVEVARGTYDITFLNPFEYVEAAGAGYLPLVRVDEPLTMVLLVPADSPITEGVGREPVPYLRVDLSLVALERDQIIAAAAPNLLGNLRPASERIQAHQTAAKVEAVSSSGRTVSSPFFSSAARCASTSACSVA